jgi:hypothetical protein
MRHTVAVAHAAATLALVALVTPAAAQTSYPNVRISGRLHQQFYGFSNSDYAAQVGPESNFFVRRARISAAGNISERVSFVIEPSFEGGRVIRAETTCDPDCVTTGRGGVRLRDAYIDVDLGDPSGTGVTLRVGQEKRPFSRLELMSSNSVPTMERGAGNGLLPVATNNIFEANGFLSHDVGASLTATSDFGNGFVTVQFGVYNGQGESLNDANGAKSYGARASVGVSRNLEIGSAFFRHDQILGSGAEADSAFYNDAWGIDAQWGQPGDPGLFVLGEYLRGEARDAARTPIAGTTLVGAWHFRRGDSGWLYAIEPALRLDVADPSLDADDDRATLVSAVLGLYLSPRARLRLGYESQTFEDEARETIAGVRSVLAISF